MASSMTLLPNWLATRASKLRTHPPARFTVPFALNRQCQAARFSICMLARSPLLAWSCVSSM